MLKLDLRKRIYTGLVLFLLLIFIFKTNYVLIYSFIIFGTLSIIEFLTLTNKIFYKKFYKFVFNSIFIIYIYLFCIIFTYFSYFIELKILSFIIICGCVASDIGGFIFGKIFKGPKLTRISPKKTISGAIGSLILSVVTVFILFFYLKGIYGVSILMLGIITSISSQIGDLFFSFLKRKASVKDTGNIFPGHGGVLDRIDGILFGLPVGTITIFFLI